MVLINIVLDTFFFLSLNCGVKRDGKARYKELSFVDFLFTLKIIRKRLQEIPGPQLLLKMSVGAESSSALWEAQL